MAIAGLYKIFDHWHKEGAVWIISDTHFGDEELKEGFLNRPTDDELVKLINSKCGRKDTLIHLGDVGDLSYVKKLRAGKKILICGNHDIGHTNYLKRTNTKKFDKDKYTVEEALKEMKNLYPDCRYGVGEEWGFIAPFDSWLIYAYNDLFDEVYTGPLMISEKIILSHEPIAVPWAYNIHGHSHTGPKTGNGTLNVCADVIGYTPLNFNQLMKSGLCSKIETLHRTTIDKATVKNRKRGGKPKWK